MITVEKIKNLLDKFGISAVLKDYPAATFNPSLNTVTKGTMSTVNVKAVPPYQNREGYTKPSLVTSGTGLTGIANSDLGALVIRAGMIISINGVDWTIVGVTPIGTANGTVYFQLEIEV